MFLVKLTTQYNLNKKKFLGSMTLFLFFSFNYLFYLKFNLCFFCFHSIAANSNRKLNEVLIRENGFSKTEITVSEGEVNL